MNLLVCELDLNSEEHERKANQRHDRRTPRKFGFNEGQRAKIHKGRIVLKIFNKEYCERVATSADREAYKHDLPGFQQSF